MTDKQCAVLNNNFPTVLRDNLAVMLLYLPIMLTSIAAIIIGWV